MNNTIANLAHVSESTSFVGRILNQLTLFLENTGVLSQQGRLKPNFPAQEFKSFIDKKISQFIVFLKNARDNFCLDTNDAWQEINTIRAKLNDKQIAGYIFSNDNQINHGHFDILLIAKDRYIIPVLWNVPKPFNASKNDSIPLYVTDLSPFMHKNLYPQLDWGSCGTLGMVYLRKLLKNNAEDYQNLSLSCAFYSENNKVYFFMPCPSVVLYSQSSVFNDGLMALLSDCATGIVALNKKIQVTTLKKMLENSLIIAREQGDVAMINDNQTTLSLLPSFSKKWLAEMVKINKSRIFNEQLNHSGSVISNPYLLFQSHRNKALIDGLTEVDTQQITNKIA